MQNLAIVSCKEIVNLPLDKIIPNPYQPRKRFDKLALEELSKSILKYGIMQPLNVRYINGMIYELVAGERRLRAAKIAGLTEVPVIIVNISDKDSAAIALIENIQRENLSFFEEAEGYQSLMVDFGYTQDEIADLMGKSQSTVANKLRILRLNRNIKNIIIDENLTERHARALLKLNDEKLQEEVLKKVIKFGLNVARTEDLIETTIKKINGEEEIKPKTTIKGYIGDIRLFTNTIKSAVNIMKEAGVETDYEMVHNDNGYEIRIKVVM